MLLRINNYYFTGPKVCSLIWLMCEMHSNSALLLFEIKVSSGRIVAETSNINILPYSEI